MKFREIFIIIIIASLFVSSGLLSQTAMYAKKHSGSQKSYDVSDIVKMSFHQGDLIIAKTNGINESYSLGDLRYIAFNDFSTDIYQNDLGLDYDNIIYPNPVIDNLTVSLNFKLAGQAVFVDIFDLHGRAILNSYHTNSDIKEFSINVSNLPKGVYVLRLMSNDIVIVKKFIKQ